MGAEIMIKLKELLSEKCWKGYEKKGTKKMFGKTYPNCVKKEEKITEAVDFRVKIEDRKGKLIQGGNFTLKSDANLYIKDMIKKHKLRRGKGNWWNAKGIELTTNF